MNQNNFTYKVNKRTASIDYILVEVQGYVKSVEFRKKSQDDDKNLRFIEFQACSGLNI